MEISEQYIHIIKKIEDSFPSLLKKEDLKILDKIFGRIFNQKNKIDISNLFGVSKIVVEEIGLGRTSLLCTIIFHFSSKYSVSVGDIQKQIPESYYNIVDGLLKVEELHKKSKKINSDNFRKLLLNFANDIRVILISNAFLLYDFRNLNVFTPKKQNEILDRIRYLYLPFSRKLGLHRLVLEMEDKILAINEPKIFEEIKQKLDETSDKRNEYINKFLKPIQHVLTEENLNFVLKSRLKSISSILNKIRTKEVEFEEIYDIFAIRIILNSKLKEEKKDCWRVYSLISDIYRPNPERLRDWITIPKSNGYESLQTTVMGLDNEWVEIQIRTTRMNEFAEKGFAAHYKYKGKGGDKILDQWLHSFKEILDDATKEEFVGFDELNFEFENEEIYVFTPKGDLKQLPKGSTLLDFAYSIHSEVGDKCIGGLANQKNVPLKYLLKNGDQVSVYTSQNQKPNADWLNFVVTSKARNKIRQSLDNYKSNEANIGREILERRLKNWRIEFNDKAINKLLVEFKYKLAQDLYSDISLKKINLIDIKNVLLKVEEEDISNEQDYEKIVLNETESEATQKDVLVIANEVSNVDYKLSPCCNPVFGDRIFGFITVADGIKVHRENCPNAHDLHTRYPYRIIHTKWTSKTISDYKVRLRISGEDQIGMINRITNLISNDLCLNIRSFLLHSNVGKSFDCTIELKVKSTNQLDLVINKLLKLKGVRKVSRSDST